MEDNDRPNEPEHIEADHRSSENESQRLLNKEQIHQLVSNRLSNFRNLAWEDDFSKNSLDTEPFENRPPISERLDELDGLDTCGFDIGEIKKFAQRDSAPIPSPDDRERYSVNHDCQYWFSGLRDYLDLMEIVRKYSISINRVFDFGCASGRVLRHFAAHSEIGELWGSDINARHIRWLSDFMPKTVKPVANHCIPQLPVQDSFFDLVTAFSVFTHIDTFETCWLAEIKRILAPGGLAYLTIHNEDTWRLLRDEIDNEDNRLVQSMISVNPDVREQLSGDLPQGRTVYRFTHRGPYRAQVFHSNSYIENVWGRFFEIVDILPCHHVRQSVVLLR